METEKKYKSHNKLILNRISLKYQGCTPQFINKSIKSPTKSELSKKICKDYHVAKTKIEAILDEILIINN